jgi:hypothetical protein
VSVVMTWVTAVVLIAAFSAALVFIDPLTLIADWWDVRQVRKMSRPGPGEVCREVSPDGVRTVTLDTSGEHVWNVTPWLRTD